MTSDDLAEGLIIQIGELSLTLVRSSYPSVTNTDYFCQYENNGNTHTVIHEIGQKYSFDKHISLITTSFKRR